MVNLSCPLWWSSDPFWVDIDLNTKCARLPLSPKLGYARTKLIAWRFSCFTFDPFVHLFSFFESAMAAKMGWRFHRYPIFLRGGNYLDEIQHITICVASYNLIFSSSSHFYRTDCVMLSSFSKYFYSLFMLWHTGGQKSASSYKEPS